MGVPLCTGEVSTGAGGEAVCSVAWVSSDEWAISSMDPVTMAQAFGAGFVVVGMFYLLGHAIRAIISTVRR